MPEQPLPILYSFRRCPYAMRARLAIYAANLTVELREVVLKYKPAELIEVSPKATVPVCVLPNKTVIDESLAIMHWALSQHDPGQWLRLSHSPQQALIDELIATNDGSFKQALDRYKYADRFPENSAEDYRQLGEAFLQELNQLLQEHNTTTSLDNSSLSLFGNGYSIADVAILPFVRQFAHVDRNWFFNSQYRPLQNWLNHFLESDLFKSIMQKYQPWQSGSLESDRVLFGNDLIE